MSIGHGRCRCGCGVGCGSRTHNRTCSRTRILRPCRRQQHAGCQGCQQRPITARRCTSHTWHAQHTGHAGYTGCKWESVLSIHVVESVVETIKTMGAAGRTSHRCRIHAQTQACAALPHGELAVSVGCRDGPACCKRCCRPRRQNCGGMAETSGTGWKLPCCTTHAVGKCR